MSKRDEKGRLPPFVPLLGSPAAIERAGAATDRGGGRSEPHQTI
jgi:hypothetical protein